MGGVGVQKKGLLEFLAPNCITFCTIHIRVPKYVITLSPPDSNNQGIPGEIFIIPLREEYNLGTGRPFECLIRRRSERGEISNGDKRH